MAIARTTTLTFHIAPVLKGALREAAIRKHHSIANMVKVLILGSGQPRRDNANHLWQRSSNRT